MIVALYFARGPNDATDGLTDCPSSWSTLFCGNRMSSPNDISRAVRCCVGNVSQSWYSPVTSARPTQSMCIRCQVAFSCIRLFRPSHHGVSDEESSPVITTSRIPFCESAITVFQSTPPASASERGSFARQRAFQLTR